MNAATLHPQLSAAISAEISFQQDLAKEQLNQSANSLRKLGLSLFPLEINEHISNAEGDLIRFQTSFPINDQFFKRGAHVRIVFGTSEVTGRIQELDVQSGSIFVSDETIENLKDETVSLFYLPDDRTFQCMELGIRLAETHPKLQEFIKDFQKPAIPVLHEHPELNTSQQMALGAILSEDLTVVIQGPPGTGKSHTLAVAVEKLVTQGKRLILSAPSNTAVDQLCLKLLQRKVPLLRVGNDEKIHAAILPYTADGYLEKGTLSKTLQQLEKSRRAAEQVMQRRSRNFNKELAEEKRMARKEFVQLRKEIRQLKRRTEIDLLESIPVIAGTPVAIFNVLSKDFTTDIVIIDEAGQSLTPLTYLAASFGNRLVLCGDPQQLPPVVMSNEAKQQGLHISLLETVSHLRTPILLNEQYRMAPEIVAAINPYFYDNQLLTAPNNPQGKLEWIDMAGFGNGETPEETNGSISNKDEVDIVQKLLETEGLSPQLTVLLSPYSAQIALLQKTLGKTWNVSTIDAIQGQEAAHIVISLTRSNPEQIIGFLKDYRRTNVAISRAKQSCYLIGDSATLGSDAFYLQLIEFIENTGHYRSAWEFV